MLRSEFRFILSVMLPVILLNHSVAQEVVVAGTQVSKSETVTQSSTQNFVVVFSAGVYEDGIDGNATWASGDWNGDGDFDSSDFVTAFSDGGYEEGPRVPGVPEPGLTPLAFLTALTLPVMVARRRRS